MTKISISKNDILWSYLAQFFSLTSGILVLPLILNLLTVEEIGFNYLMLTISSFAILLDFGFSPQFKRNISYIFSGSQQIKEEGVEKVHHDSKVNLELLVTMIKTIRFVYLRLGLLIFFLLLTLGTIYIYYVSNGFAAIDNTLTIWLIFSLSVFFNIYYSYYHSLLLGKGMISEYNKSIIFSKLFYLFFTYVVLFLDFGLLGLTISGLISPFVGRYICHYYFFDKEIVALINKYKIHKNEIIKMFKVVFVNAKKMGLVTLSAFLVQKFGLFISGLFLTLDIVASYGLLIQISGLSLGISTTLFITYQPKLSSLRVEDNKRDIIRIFSMTHFIFLLIFIFGGVFIIYFGPQVLDLINSNTILPSRTIMIVFFIILFLEANHSLFASLILTDNKVPFTKSAIISGVLIVIGSYIALAHFSAEILGLIIIQGVVQACYNNWRWPQYICNEFKIKYLEIVRIGSWELMKKLNLIKS